MICVVHLVRAANGVAPLREFLDSYRRFDAGAAHELLVVCKGFAEDTLDAEYERALAGVDHRRRFVPDEGFDLDAYLLVAREVDAAVFCFLNSFSVVLADGWLAKLAGPAARPEVGIAGATGSFESMHTNLISDLGPLDPDQVLAARPDLAAIVRDFPPFPNPHVRTNAFACRRELLVAAANGPLRTKHDAHAFESGVQGLTRRLREQGLAALVVGSDGREYPEGEWCESRTFRSGTQENLLVADNQTRRNLLAGPADRELLRRYAWGDRANGYGLLKPDAAPPTTSVSPEKAGSSMSIKFSASPETLRAQQRKPRETFCTAVREFADDPRDAARRAAVAEAFAALEAVTPLREAQDAVGLQATGLPILASASDVVAQPELLAAFAAAFSAADPVTLVLDAAGGDQAELELALAGAVDAAGMQLDGSPDAVLFLPELDAAGAELLARSAVARLSPTRADDEELVSFTGDQLPALHALVGILGATGTNGSNGHGVAAERAPMKVNVGCGQYPFEGWFNIDIDPNAPAQYHGAIPPLPLGDESVDEIYAGHFLEHLDYDDGTAFLRECFRVLRPGGKVGIVVPDTRAICERYLAGLETLDDVCRLFFYSTVQDTHHKWSYDLGSLGDALRAAGFVVMDEIDRNVDPRLVCPAWFQCGLDAEKPRA